MKLFLEDKALAEAEWKTDVRRGALQKQRWGTLGTSR